MGENKVKTFFIDGRIVSECTDLARELYNLSRYGEVLEDKTVQLSLCEALYLLEKNKITVHMSNGKEIAPDKLMKKAIKLESNFWVRYRVFKDFRSRGYIIKTALKFGADFRVYDRGVKPGEDHAKWIVFPVKEEDALTWYEFSSKNRVAHSTKKNLLIACVDEEGDVTYWEVKWVRP
jgi:tRNA-intron endonuclease